MIPCFSTVSLLSADLPLQLAAAAEAGFTLVEVWLTQLEEHLARHGDAQLRSILEDKQIRLVSAAYQGGLLLSQGEARREHYQQLQERLSLCQQFGVQTLIIAPDFADMPTPQDWQRAEVSLKQAAQLASSYQVRLALEFQSPSRWCTCLPTALALLAAVDEPNVGLCLDLFHFYTGCSKLEDLGYLPSQRLFMVHMSDLSGVPREWARDADRILPGDGEMPLDDIVKLLQQIGYEGPFSLELMNPQLWSIAPAQVTSLGMQSLRRLLDRKS